MNTNNIDFKSLRLDGIDTKDFPDFCDAYISNGYYLDGTPLPDTVLAYLTDILDVNELAHESFY